MKKKDLERYAMAGLKERINNYIESRALFLWGRKNGKKLCHEDYCNDPGAIVPCVKILIPNDSTMTTTSSVIILTIVNAPIKKAGDDDGCKDSWLRMELVMALKKPTEKQNDDTGKDIPEDTKNSLTGLKEAFLAFASIAWKNKETLRNEFNNVITEGQTPSQSFEMLVERELPALKIKVSCVDKEKLYRGSVVAFFEGLDEFAKYLEELELRMTVAFKAGLLTCLSKKDKNKYF